MTFERHDQTFYKFQMVPMGVLATVSVNAWHPTQQQRKLFFELKPHTNFQNLGQPPTGRKVTQAEEKDKEQRC